MALTNAATKTMKLYLSETYHIPDYQREYAWENDQLNDFWDDLVFTKSDPDGMSHFFGQIVIHNSESENKQYIIDGQQRTITSVIFLRALQLICEDIYQQTKSKGALEIIQGTLGLIGSYSEFNGNSFQLVLSEADREWFQNNIQLGLPEKMKPEKKKSRERMRKALIFFKSKLLIVLEEFEETDLDTRLRCLYEYFKTFSEKFEVLYLAATKEEEAFIIFETLNARGKSLETADLLKNYIFRQSGNVSEAQKQWNSMISALGQADPTKYIRHFWNSSHDFQREKTLYRAITETIKTPKQSKELLKALNQCAPYYRSISNPEDDNIFENKRLMESLNALKVLKGQLFFPVVLAMVQAEFASEDIALVVSSIECYMLRNFTICRKAANESERFFAATAKAIFDEKLTTAADICKHIQAKIVVDDEFRLSFENWTTNEAGKPTVRYIFSKIHKYLDKGMELNIDTSEVHVEHIMPVKTTKWMVTNEIHETYLWRLGNLMLLSGTFNENISNNPFVLKKGKYAESKIEPNKDVCEYDEWGPDQIEDRQKKLAEYAVIIWK